MWTFLWQSCCFFKCCILFDCSCPYSVLWIFANLLLPPFVNQGCKSLIHHHDLSYTLQKRSCYTTIEEKNLDQGSFHDHATALLVHTLVTFRFDIGESLFNGISKKLMKVVQFVQNATVRILTKTRKHSHITTFLRICLDFQFGIVLILNNAIYMEIAKWHSFAPAHLQELLKTYSTGRSPTDFSLLFIMYVAPTYAYI